MPAVHRSVAAALVLTIGPAAAIAQPASPDSRTGGILAADLALDAIFLVRDADGDGIADSATVFFGEGNADGLALPTRSVFGIFQAADRTVYFSDGDTDTVYAIRDNNGDGDAMDVGEARVWFRSGLFNNLNWVMETPNGITGHDGAIYIANAGVGSAQDDAIYRTVDLDGIDGANGVNEATLWFNASANIPSANPFDLCFIGDNAYFADLRGSADDVIFELRDADNNGIVEPEDFNIFVTEGDQGIVCDFSCVTDGVSLFTHNLSGVQSIFSMRDLNNSNTIDAANEADEIWNESLLPSGSVLQNSFAIAHGPISPVRMMAISSHGSAAQDAIYLLRDLDTSGDFLQAEETTAFITGVSEDSVFPENIRTLCFYAPVCRGDFDRSGDKGVPDIFAFLSAWFALDPAADVDGVEGIAVPDIFAFLSLWFGPC
jgi:hypothetical protein